MKKRLNHWSNPRLKKKQKQCSHRRRRSSLDDEDRISCLPDEILLSIMSLLTFKEVALTSILSRQWRKFWVHYPLLNFLSPNSDVLGITERQRQDYVNWVNSVLQLHMGQYLKEFSIICELGNKDRKDIDSWLEYALARKVQHFELNFCGARLHTYNQHVNYVFPERLLNLSHEKATHTVNSKGGGCCPDFKSLKSLSLKRVDVNGEAINFFLLNCPYLERLEVSGTSKLVNLVISDTTLVLKHLEITDCHNLEVLSISNFNLVSLNISIFGDVTLIDLPMLVELSLSGYSDQLSRCFSRSFSCHSQLEALTFNVLELQDIIQLSNLSQMTKLKKLDIQIGTCADDILTKLFSFINYCPHLMEFVLKVTWFSPMRISRALSKVEKCSLNCLEVFEFMGYYGRVGDVELIMHILENAVCLKKIIVVPRNIYDGLSTSVEDHEVRSVSLPQLEGLRDSIPHHVDFVIL